MTVERDPRLDAVLTAQPKEAWQIIFEKLWEIFSGPLTPQHVEQEVTERERTVSELELLLSSSAWELWHEFEGSVPHTAQSVIDFWNVGSVKFLGPGWPSESGGPPVPS